MEALVQKKLLNVFCETENLISEQSGILSCYMKHISMNKNDGQIQILMETPETCTFKDIVDCENALKQKYGFNDVDIFVTYTKGFNTEMIFGDNYEYIKYFIRERSPAMMGFFNNAVYEADGNSINIRVPESYIKIINENKYFSKMNRYIEHMSGGKCRIRLKDKVLTEEEIQLNKKKRESFEKYEIREIHEKNERNENHEIHESLPKEIKGPELYEEPVKVKKINYKRKSIEKSRGSAKTENGENIIMGRDFAGKIIPLNDINENTGKAAVIGKIFSCDFRLLKDGGLLVSFEITDETNSIMVKFFGTSSDEEYCRKHIKEGKWLRIYGEVQYDNFIRDVSIRAQYIIEHKPKIETDNAAVKRVELHLHTKMSKMDSVCDISELIKQASDWGHKAVAITDHGVVQAYPEAYETVITRKLDIKIIYGVESYLLNDDDCDNPEDFDYKSAHPYHCIILVKNLTGLKNLYKLISESYLNYFYKSPKMPKKLIEKYREGLLIGSACESGEVYQAVLKGDPKLPDISKFYDYFEIQPLGNNKFMLRNEIVKNEQELKDINLKIVKLADESGKLCVATCDVHFLKKNDEIYRRILMAGQKYDDADHQAPLYFRNTEEMLKEFEYLGSDRAQEVVVDNTNRIADMIENIQPIPSGTFYPSLDNSKEHLEEISYKRAKEIYGDELPGLVRERMEKELKSIIGNGFSVMYMIAQKLVKKSMDDGYLVGSRGSVGSSLIANMAGITEVNSLPAHYICPGCKYSEFITDGSYGCGFDLPDKKCPNCGENLKKDGYDIPFETFLGFEGDKTPDIDLNFSGDYQARAHKYTEELFGEGYVYRAGTINTIADKTAYGFVKNYFEEKDARLRSAEINRITKGCTGVKKTTGQHPGGIVIIPKDKEVFDFTPIQHPADDAETDIITTHFDFNFLHDSILKLDILGHDDPTMIRMLEDLTGVDAKTIEIGEKSTMSLFSSTKALGVKPEDIGSETGTLAVPEFGTGFVRQMLVDTKPKKFSELISISGLSHGTDVWLGNAQELIKSGKTLSEAICCRDDIMIYLIHKGLPSKSAFKIMEDVRKGKGLTADNKKIMEEHKVPDWYIESCVKIKYMFPKAHAAAYVMMAFRIAWYKVYYPLAFYAAFFTVRADEFDAEICSMGRDKLQNSMDKINEKGNDMTPREESLLKVLEVVNEMYARGFEFLPVDLYKSDSRKFLIEESRIRPPFNAISGLGDQAAEKIVSERKLSSFMSVDDLKNRTKLSKTVIESLRRMGCLEGLTETDQLTLF